MTDFQIPNLVGRIIAVKYGSGPRDFAYIEVVGLESQAGRLFLVGTTVTTGFDDASGHRFCVAWDAVTSYYDFDSIEECHRAIAAWYPPEKKSRSWFR